MLKILKLKSIVFFVCIVFSFDNLEAQNNDDNNHSHFTIDSAKLIVKFELLSGLSAYSNLQFAAEYKIKSNLYIQHAVGYIVGYNNYTFSNPELDSPNGWNFRTEPRFYLSYNRAKRRGFYVAPEISYRYIYANDEQQKMESCGGDCFFIRRITFKAVRQDIALNFKVGIQKILNGLVAFDYFIGMGPKFVWYDADAPKDIDSNSVFLRREERVKYNITVGFKVGILLK